MPTYLGLTTCSRQCNVCKFVAIATWTLAVIGVWCVVAILTYALLSQV